MPWAVDEDGDRFEIKDENDEALALYRLESEADAINFQIHHKRSLIDHALCDIKEWKDQIKVLEKELEEKEKPCHGV